jgi:leader peptidase (prepilin peptidase)/N-methyltransferase
MFDLGVIDAIGANPTAFAAAACGLGLLTGSFLNVVILRLPRRLAWEEKQFAREILALPDPYEPAPPGIVVEASHCPHCGHKLAPWENIPVLSYLALGGRCRKCKARISLQYPAVELVTGLLFLACALRFGYGPQAGLGMVFCAYLVALTGIDLRTQLLPNELTQPLLWIGLVASLGSIYVKPSQAVLGAFIGYYSLWTVYWAFKLIRGKEGMGYGDFWLMSALGAWCGPFALLPILLMASFAGAVIGSVLLWRSGSDSDTPFAFGPYLAAAGLIQFFSGVQLVDALRWFAPG